MELYDLEAQLQRDVLGGGWLPSLGTAQHLLQYRRRLISAWHRGSITRRPPRHQASERPCNQSLQGSICARPKSHGATVFRHDLVRAQSGAPQACRPAADVKVWGWGWGWGWDQEGGGLWCWGLGLGWGWGWGWGWG
ncbi:hypothetical protein B484DRAFT_397638 [Ochromonadaceae sp. CCMP2298]|nr:hypothetical protein B484DRAFT_397638 [Ochromonadaceae sp. CCMP2298]